MFILQPEQSSQLVTCVAYNSATDPECNSRLSPEQCRQVIGWSDWLKPLGGKLVNAPKTPGGARYKVIEAAPGRYVKAKA